MRNEPYVLDETSDFAVVYKPPRMHCAPLKSNDCNTLINWYASIFPPVMEISGRKEGEGGLLHRLDFETQGLVLFARNQRSFDFLSIQQDKGNFVKEYSAICQKSDVPLDSAAPAPVYTGQADYIIESCFRPFGHGRKEVRPVTEPCKKEHTGPYQTEIISINKMGEHTYFTISLKKGFRHQIRCHLAWIGYPIVNDPVYAPSQDQPKMDGFLALRAHGLVFPDPQSGEVREYRIPPIS